MRALSGAVVNARNFVETAWANKKFPFAELSNDVDLHTFSIEQDEPFCELPFVSQGWKNVMIVVQTAVLYNAGNLS